MSRFCIAVKPAVMPQEIHMRLYVRREQRWVLCGVFHMERGEWDELGSFLTNAGIEVVANEPSE